MAYQQKTGVLDQTVDMFLAGVEPAGRQAEARALVHLFFEVSGYTPRVYSGGMVGFGAYDYRYDSGHAGSSFATGFAPRKAEISIYILPGYANFAPILARLGKHRTGKACLYLKRLSDADPVVLAELIAAGLADLKTRWTVRPS